VAVLAGLSTLVQAETWVPTTGDGSWGDTANWSPASVPNAVGASATFDSPTGTRTATLGDTNSYTVGSLNLTNNSASTTTIRNNSTATRGAATLHFDAAGSGPVVITAGGTGTNQHLITADMVFDDTVNVNITTNGGNASAGMLSLTGDITGPGGLTKDGIGLMTMAFIAGQTAGVKQYQGPTVINNGRFRHSFGGTPSMTSSVTVNNGGQIELITNSSTYTYGTSAATMLNLNGFGPTSGTLAAFPGAIRPSTGLVISIANNVVLQSDSMVHMQGSATGALTFTGNVSGKGIFVAGSIPHDNNVGRITFQGTNTYAGGTIINVGTLEADAASTNAFGSGTLQVISANLSSGGSQAHAHIVAGATNAIADTAYLNLAGGNVVDSADDGYIDLDGGVNETIGGLMLAGTIIPAGVYGSSGSGAANNGTLTGLGINPDEFFVGGGTVTVSATACGGGVCVPGDYNANGIVDAPDYVVWRKGGTLANDFTPGVQAADYDFWRSRFGATTNPGSGSGLTSASVPEASTLPLAALLAVLLGSYRRVGHNTRG
jgi:autotransporter-associated beta strand protein